MSITAVIRWMATAACAAFLSINAHAQTGDRQDPNAVRQAVENYLRAQTSGLPGEVTFSVGALDSRLVLASCPALEVFLPSGGRLWGNTSVGVRCGGATPWSLYVTAQVRVISDYVIAARPLAQGQPLSAGDFSIRRGDMTQLSANTLTGLQQVEGKTLASSLAAGQPLRLDMLRSPVVVQQGQSVKLQSSGNGFTVSAEGKALNNAAEGQVVQARTSSGQTLSGIARAGGIVEMRF